MMKLNRLAIEQRVGFPVNSESSLDTWRSAKRKLDGDNDYRSQLGCVGEPLADALDQVLKYIPCLDDRADVAALLSAGATDARANLLEYANDARQAGADEILSDLECALSFDPYDIEPDIDWTFRDAAEAGFDACVSRITGECWNVSQVTDEEL